MKTIKRFMAGGGLVVMLSLVACATAPTLTGKWRDESYTGKFNNVLVVGISSNQTARRLFEDTVVSSLKGKGVEATALSRVAPGDAVPDKSTVENVVKEKSFGSVITTRMIGKEKDSRYVPGTPYVAPPPYYHGMYNYFGTVYPVVYSPGYLVNDTIVSLESNGYDTAADKLVWSITTELFNPSDVDKEIKGLVELIIKQLQESGLI